MTIDHLFQRVAAGDRPVRPRRLQADQREGARQMAQQAGVLPGETGGRMQTEQRRAVAVAQPQDFAGAAAFGAAARLRLIQQRRHIFHAAGKHNLPNRQRAPRLLTQLRRQPHGEQRMPAQREEIVPSADAVALQNTAEQPGHQYLAVAVRRPPVACRYCGCGRALRSSLPLALSGKLSVST
ncbi:Uncharacterised protein [Serratia rubidaea]|uniref:Uncharacterized protein n=1 Tax=Serratia rubidaea TaxID=61652 RepID=A0A4U9HGN2_SERRU|nr:Uncharacterised protein [Serratia rubidaea]